MVKIGFIVEGGTEKIVVESSQFVSWLREQGLELIFPVIDAKGGGNLLPDNIEPLVARLQNANADHIVILTDLEDASGVEVVKNRIKNQHTELVFVAVKAIEAWFLADTTAMNNWLKTDTDFYEDHPEQTTEMPWARLKEIAKTMNLQGPGATKVIFAKKMVKHYAFSVSGAAQHPACLSAKGFHDGLLGLLPDAVHGGH